MTKVQTTFKLYRALSDQDLNQISRVHGVYGMLSTKVQPSGDEIQVEYDASRLSLKEVRSVLEARGLPLT
jgi:copper chaperone CopZ